MSDSLNSSLVTPAQTPPPTAQNQSVINYDQSISNYVVYLTQDKFKPNKDNGVTFYYGIVTNIVDKNTQNSDIRDIFNIRSDQIERKNLTSTKYNSERVTFYVHIPALHSIIFSSEIPLKKDKNRITPEDLYKFRIEANAPQVRSQIKIGNVVKIKFENHLNFLNGTIEEKVEDEILQIKPDPETQQEAKKAFEENNCAKTAVNPATGQGRTIVTDVLAFSDLTNVGLFDFIETFVTESISAAESRFLPNGESSVYRLEVSPPTNSEILQFRSDTEFAKVPFSTELTPENVVQTVKCLLNPSKDISNPKILKIKILTKEKNTKENLKKFFLSYLKETYSLDTKAEGDNILITFKTTQDTQTPEQFYNYSKTRYNIIKEYNIVPQQTVASQAINNNSNQTEPSKNSECEDNVAIIESYINTQKSDWKRSSKDKPLIDWFFNQIKIQNPNLLSIYGQFTISNSFNVVNVFSETTYTNDFYNANPDFYIPFSSDEDIVERNSLEGEIPAINYKKLKNNYERLAANLRNLRDYIVKNEGLTTQTVLVLPLSWTRVKPTNISTDVDEDPNDQRCYGRAVELVVYIKFNNIIYQVPPEIVYLYVVKVLGNKQIGIGIFSDVNSYIYYENLAGLIFSNPEDNNRYWTSVSGKDELEKQLNKVSPKDFTDTIKAYVSTKYSSTVFNDIARKIRNLL